MNYFFQKPGMILGFFLICSLVAFEAGAENLRYFLMRDKPASLTLPEEQFELSVDLIGMNEQIDILNVRDSQVSSSSSASLGDLRGVRVIANYGLFADLTLHGQFAKRNLDYGLGDYDIDSYDLGFRYNLFNDLSSRWPFIAFDFGLKADLAADQKITDEAGLNSYLHRAGFSSQYSIEIDKDYVWFTKEDKDGKVSLGISRKNGPVPDMTINDVYDLSIYSRITAGKLFDNFFPNFFVEGGYTQVKGSIDSSLMYYAKKAQQYVSIDLPDLPQSLDRKEAYLKVGSNMMYMLPIDVLLSIEYDFIYLKRQNTVNINNTNHILKGEISWFFYDNWALNLGGVYMHNQYNGVIPFLYNEYTQNTFTKKYGEAYLGLTFFY